MDENKVTNVGLPGVDPATTVGIECIIRKEDFRGYEDSLFEEINYREKIRKIEKEIWNLRVWGF